MPRHATLLALPLLAACASTSPAGVDARLRKLADQEATLRASVVQLEERQQALQREITAAHQRAERARCEAKRDELAATTANIWAGYSMRYAESQACKADAAKGGTLATALGCGLGLIVTGGWGALLCGGAFVAGQAAGASCQEASLPPREQLQREALAHLGLKTPPNCDALPRPAASPPAPAHLSTVPTHVGTGRANSTPPPASPSPPAPAYLVGTGRANSAPPAAPLHLVGTGPAGMAAQPTPAPASAPPQPVPDPAAEARRRQREGERARAAHQAREKAAAEDRARVRAAQLDAEWAREKALRKSRRRAKAQ